MGGKGTLIYNTIAKTKAKYSKLLKEYILLLLLLLLLLFCGCFDENDLKETGMRERRFNFSQADFQTPLLTFPQHSLRAAFSSIFETESGERFRARLLKCDILHLCDVK